MCYTGTDEEADSDCGSDSSRWSQVKSALTAFFQSPDSAGVFVSVIPFPQAASGFCSASEYDTVPNGFPAAEALPSSGTPSLGNNPTGGTPTAYAIQGGLTFTQGQSGLPANAKTAMLIATDGTPANCVNQFGSDPIQPSLDAAAATVSAGISLYVLGIGGQEQFGKLDQIAAAAQTNGNQAFKIDSSDPSGVGAAVLAALSTIRGEELSCNLAIPAAPDGQSLDYDKVNVVYTPAGGSDEVLAHSDDCADTNGWKYDDPAAPTTIELCDGACAEAKSGSLSIVLGCATQGPN